MTDIPRRTFLSLAGLVLLPIKLFDCLTKRKSIIERIVKSGVIIRIPLNSGEILAARWYAASKSGCSQIEAWVDNQTDSLMIKIRHWDEHQHLAIVPEATRYPEIHGDKVAQIIEDQSGEKKNS